MEIAVYQADWQRCPFSAGIGDKANKPNKANKANRPNKANRANRPIGQ